MAMEKNSREMLNANPEEKKHRFSILCAECEISSSFVHLGPSAVSPSRLLAKDRDKWSVILQQSSCICNISYVAHPRMHTFACAFYIYDILINSQGKEKKKFNLIFFYCFVVISFYRNHEKIVTIAFISLLPVFLFIFYSYENLQ